MSTEVTRSPSRLPDINQSLLRQHQRSHHGSWAQPIEKSHRQIFAAARGYSRYKQSR
ncbi:hypothetical protein PtA15_16A398 [Puccinia triticina]|uniref:Uncharacterized protein n=1 Tax=Puccinia triticina TaxID=208348 RepID=A0ABY7D6I8_9BASI|nr:uncharacterized protein PtA15_16A398 [Puccinia triticina]WAQ92490.1 hypothetical protein PtA15_16A398 [Puccinia triticina]